MSVLDFNPSATGSQITLANQSFESASDTLAYTTATSGWNVALGTIGQTSGKWYVEFGVFGGDHTASSQNLVMVGLGNASTSLTTWLGNTSNSFGLQTHGSTFNTGGTPGWSGSPTDVNSGDRIGIAVDIGNSKFWVRVNGGSWLNGDPVAETGGGTYSFSGTIYPGIALNGASAVAAQPFVCAAAISGSSHNFAAAPPTGYSPWGDTSSYSETSTFDTSYCPTSATFSNGNLTAAGNNSGSSHSGWATFPCANLINSGQFYFEALNQSSNAIFVGIMAPLCMVGDWLGNVAENGFGYDSTGDVWYLGTGTGGVGQSYASGDVACIAVDLNLKKVWIRKNGGAWYGGTSPNPATGSGGIDITAIVAPYAGFLPAVSFNDAGQATVNFGPTYTYTDPFAGTVYNGTLTDTITSSDGLSIPISSSDTIASSDTYATTVQYFGTLTDTIASRDTIEPTVVFYGTLSDIVFSRDDIDVPRTLFDGTVRKALASGGTHSALAVGGLVRKSLVSRVGVNENLNISGVSRKILSGFIPGEPAGDFGPIPVFPTLPDGFPFKVSPVVDTTVGTTKSLREMRVANQVYPIWDIEILFEQLKDQTQNETPYAPFVGYTQYQQLVQLWLQMYGATNNFYFTMPWDYSRTGQVIGTGDGQSLVFTVYRTWGTGALATEAPIGGINDMLNVYINGVAQQANTYSLGRNTIIFNNPPANGAVISCDLTFYYLGRWTEDEQDFEEFAKNRYTVTSLKFRCSPF